MFFTIIQAEKRGAVYAQERGLRVKYGSKISYYVAALIAAASVSFADDLFEGFEDWTPQTTFGNYTHAPWTVNSAAIRGYPPPPPYFAARTGNLSCWLNRWSVSTNSWAMVQLSNGVGSISFWAKAPGGTSYFAIEKSPNGTTGWTPLASFSHGSTTWTEFQSDVQEHGAFYLRIRKTGDDGNPSAYLGIDDITITQPPSKVVFSGLVTDPDAVYIGSPANIQCELTPMGSVSDLAVTSFWHVAEGAWTAVPMSNVGNTYRTISPIPAQDQVGVRVQYYVKAWFNGYEPLSPATSSTNGYTVLVRDFVTDYQTMSVTGDPAVEMTLYNDYSWQGIFAPAGTLVDAGFRFSGLHTNSLTHTWGENKSATLPFAGTAELDGPSLTIAGASSNPIVFRFSETNLEYSARECFYQSFSGWTTSGFEDDTKDGWAVYNALVGSDIDRQHAGNACYLNSNGMSAVQSPLLPDGVGEISFWYRNFSQSGSPVTECTIQKSETGGTNANEWVTIATISDIYGVDYGRFSIRLNDRHLRYVRILNSTNDAHSALCIDDVLIGFAGAGIVISNATPDPEAPTAFDPVTISANISPRANASNLVATLYYRSGSAGAFTAIGMTNSGALYTATNAIPAGSGDGHGGAGTVEYYILCEFEGYESELASPDSYPGNGSQNPASYIIAPASILISDVQHSPNPARVGTGVSIDADTQRSAGAFDVSMTTWYRKGTSGPFTGIAMTESPSDHFFTASPIPGDAEPGETVQYYLRATFLGPSAASPTYYPPGGASSPTSFVFRAAEFASAYTNTRVTGIFDTNLILIADHLWQGVATVAGFTDAAFYFETKNGGTVNWGDAAPSYTTPALFGIAGSGASQISMLGTYSNHFVFQFNETNHEYSAQRAVYVNFDDWAAASGGFGIRTNTEGWALYDGRTTTLSGEDLERAFGGAGRSCILSGTNHYAESPNIRSPWLDNGVGQIGFWYRNWRDENNLQPAGFQIQKSMYGYDWITVTARTNIISADYLHFSLTFSDPDFHYLRIVSSTNSPRARLCLDEIFVAEPGPGLAFSNVQNTPANPTMIDDVTIEADIASIKSAGDVQATVWCRAGSSGAFESLAMVNNSGHFETVAPMPRGWAGVMQYYIECSFEGMYGAERVTTYYPPKAGMAPLAYSNSSVNNAETDFEEWTQKTVFGTYTNIHGWVASDAIIRGFPPPPPYFAAHGGARSGWLNNHSPTNSWLKSPLLSNGAGMIAFWAKSAGGTITFALQHSTNGVNWTTLEEHSTSVTNGWVEYTYLLNDLTPQFVRIFKLADDGDSAGFFGIDDVTISYPPSEIRISNIQVLPAYPDDTGAPQISCEIESANPFLAAIGISASVYYRIQGQSTYSGPAFMTRSGNNFTLTQGLPAFEAGNLIDYYIRATFNGYAFSPRESRSPSYYPEGVGGTTTNQYFLAPTNTPANYYVRPEEMVGYQNFDLWTNTTAPGNYTFEGWTLNDARVTNLTEGVWHSTPWAAELLNADGSYPNSYIQCPMMTNGVGTLSFFARNTAAVGMTIEVRVSTNAGPYTTFATITNTSHSSWTRHSIDINTTTYTTIQIRKPGATYEGQTLWIDDIELSYIPTAVVISDVVRHPGYPAAGTAVDVSCKVTPVHNVVREAGNIAVGLYYRNVTRGDTAFTGPITMLPEGNIYSMLTPIPGTANHSRDLVEYYIEATFTGYSYATEKNSRSPSYYPEGELGVATDHYYAAPTNSPEDYLVRQYASDYGAITVDLNGSTTEMRQSGDETWYGQFFIGATISNALITLHGLEFYDGSTYYDSVFTWGDTNQTRAVLPYVGTMRTSDSAVVVSNMIRGSYIVRFDDQNRSYRIEQCAFQDFDTWTASPNYFERNYSQAQIAETAPDFDAWTLSADLSHPEDFKTWFVMDNYWGGICASGEVGYVISDAQIIQDMTATPATTSLTCRLDPTPGIGLVQTRPENVSEGVGTVTIEYRCLDDTFAPTLYADADTWDGVMVEAEMRATTLPKNAAGTVMGSNTWMSIFARYQNADNYYELRSEQVGLNKKRLLLKKKVAGTEYPPLWTGTTVNSSLTVVEALKLLITTYDTSKVYIEVYQGNVLKKQYWDTTSTITTGGSIGFRAKSVDLEVDDVYSGECAEQTFRGWESTTGGGPYEQDGWKITHPYQISANNWVELESSTAAGLTDHPNIRSPQLTHGLGKISFEHYKQVGDNSTVVVEWSTNEVAWTTILPLSITAPTTWSTLSLTSYDVPQSNVYVRIINSTNTPNSRVRLRNIRFEPSHTQGPHWDFTTTTNGWSDPEGTWNIANGKHAGVAVSDPLEVQVQTRPAGDEYAPWTTRATYSNRSNVGYQVDSVDVHTGDTLLVRVAHTAGNGSIVLNEVAMTSWHGDNILWTNNWRISEGWITPDPLRAGRSLQMKMSRKRSGANQCLISPLMTNGVGTLSLRNITTTGGQVSFKVDVGPSTNSWTTLAAVTNNATTWTQPGSYFGWTLNTNQSLYVRILNTSTNPEAALTIDDVTVTDFGEIDLYSWKAYNALITSAEQSLLRNTPWNINGAYLNSNTVDEVHPAQSPLDADMPYIQSGYLDAGIGEISFWYRTWDTLSEPSLLIKIAPTADTPSSNWTTIATLSDITNQTFTPYMYATYNVSNHFVRFYCDTQVSELGRICLDDVLITAPFGSEVYMKNLRLDPEVPLNTTPVHVLADVTERFLNPSNIVLTAYYRTGTNGWGTWTGLNSLPMEVASSNGTAVTYKTIDPIPAMGVDNVAQYYVSATYDGLFSEASTPKETREFTNPSWYFPIDLNDGVTHTNPYYYVFSCLPGDVWLNEINLIDDDWLVVVTQYVELAGVAAANIGNWKIEVLNTGFGQKGLYSVTNDTILPNEHNGYGFWVLGDAAMGATANMHLTNPIPDLGAIRLYRSMGAIEDGICFGDSTQARNMTNNPANGLRWIGYDDDWEANPLDVQGQGSNRVDFVQPPLWGYSNSFTPGAVNTAQVLVERNGPPPLVEIRIADLWLTDAKVWLVFTCNYTSSFDSTPWYSTNLENASGWLEGTATNHPYSSGTTYTQQFNRLTASPVYFYRVTGSW